jgi:NDP-sugar pyrophosphorylase family protein
MMDVLGRPFLEYQLSYLRKQGVTNILLCVGYLHEKIRSHFGDGKKFGLDIQYSVEDKPGGTAFALTVAESLLDEEFLFLFGDTYLQVDYAKLFGLLGRPGSLGALTVYSNPAGEFANNVLTRDGRVFAYEKGNPKGKNGVEAGANAFSRRILDYIQEGDRSLEMGVYPKLIRAGALHALVTDQRFYDIGTPQTLEYFREHAQGL